MYGEKDIDPKIQISMLEWYYGVRIPRTVLQRNPELYTIYRV